MNAYSGCCLFLFNDTRFQILTEQVFLYPSLLQVGVLRHEYYGEGLRDDRGQGKYRTGNALKSYESVSFGRNDCRDKS